MRRRDHEREPLLPRPDDAPQSVPSSSWLLLLGGIVGGYFFIVSLTYRFLFEANAVSSQREFMPHDFRQHSYNSFEPAVSPIRDAWSQSLFQCAADLETFGPDFIASRIHSPDPDVVQRTTEAVLAVRKISTEFDDLVQTVFLQAPGFSVVPVSYDRLSSTFGSRGYLGAPHAASNTLFIGDTIQGPVLTTALATAMHDLAYRDAFHVLSESHMRAVEGLSALRKGFDRVYDLKMLLGKESHGDDLSEAEKGRLAKLREEFQPEYASRLALGAQVMSKQWENYTAEEHLALVGKNLSSEQGGPVLQVAGIIGEPPFLMLRHKDVLHSIVYVSETMSAAKMGEASEDAHFFRFPILFPGFFRVVDSQFPLIVPQGLVERLFPEFFEWRGEFVQTGFVGTHYSSKAPLTEADFPDLINEKADASKPSFGS